MLPVLLKEQEKCCIDIELEVIGTCNAAQLVCGQVRVGVCNIRNIIPAFDSFPEHLQ